MNFAEQLEAFSTGRGVSRVVEIHQQQVVACRAQPIANFLNRARRIGLETRAAEQQTEGGDDVRLVVGDQDPARDGRIGGSDG